MYIGPVRKSAKCIYALLIWPWAAARFLDTEQCGSWTATGRNLGCYTRELVCVHMAPVAAINELQCSVKCFLNKRELNFRNIKYSHIITHQVVGDTYRKQPTWRETPQEKKYDCLRDQAAPWNRANRLHQKEWPPGCWIFRSKPKGTAKRTSTEHSTEGWKGKKVKTFFSYHFISEKELGASKIQVPKITSKTLECQKAVLDEKHQPKKNETM